MKPTSTNRESPWWGLPIMLLCFVGWGPALGAIEACEAVKPTCQIIHVASDVCTVIEYVGDDGKVHQEPVDSRELAGLAKAYEARRLKDAGVDAR